MWLYKRIILVILTVVVNFKTLSAQQKLNIVLSEANPPRQSGMFHKPDDPLIQYTGRIQTTNSSLPRFWAPGVYVKAEFNGDVCQVFLNDEVLWGNSHNYIEVIVDNKKPGRLQLKWKNNEIKIEGLSRGNHTITICKNTESGIGYLEFAGINCKKLLKLPAKPTRKIEFIGNSITCGTGMDLSEVPCGKGQWYHQHNAYMSYGPLTARALNAQWVLSSVSGIGLVHSCCNMAITMPQVFDKIDMRDDSIEWNFVNYIPNVVTICLGQNDGIQDSTIFCNAYIQFIKNIRDKYPDAALICLTSPMADSTLSASQKNYLSSMVSTVNKSGDKEIYKYFFSKQYHHGCGGHPDLKEHKMIAAELIRYIKNLENW